MSKEDYSLCMRQWNSVPNLYKILLDAGRLPEWLRKRELSKGIGKLPQ